MSRAAPRLLDLFCGAGGAAMGYSRAGFAVVGVDSSPQPRYPFEFHEADAMSFPLDGFDAIHASPPCQLYSVTKNLHPRSVHPDLVGPTRERLLAAGVPYVIENVPGAPLLSPYQLCGSMFGLHVRRHRLFETSFPLLVPTCQHGVQPPRFLTQRGRGKNRRTRLASVVNVTGNDTSYSDTHYLAGVVGVYGHSPSTKGGGLDVWKAAMDIDWMGRAELAQAIPPAYTELIGWQLRSVLGG